MNFGEGLECNIDGVTDKSLQFFDRFGRRDDVCSLPKTDETILPGGSDDKDDLGFHEFLRDNPSLKNQPSTYPTDEGVCPPAIFGRSNIPVCEEIGYTVVKAEPGHNYYNLVDVYIRMSSSNDSVTRF